jgi:acetyltransferase-like isoleucine patch superfamily enzyme
MKISFGKLPKSWVKIRPPQVAHSSLEGLKNFGHNYVNVMHCSPHDQRKATHANYKVVLDSINIFNLFSSPLEKFSMHQR